MRWEVFGAAAAVVVLVSGCAAPQVGTERSLGAVPYAEAFQAARTVVGQYFTVGIADSETGEIRSAPKPLTAGGLGARQTRQVAVVRIRQAGGQVIATATINVQWQSAAAMRQMARPASTYDGPPHQTPAELEAATTPQQNEAWITERRDRRLEFQLLTDIYNALHPPSATQESAGGH